MTDNGGIEEILKKLLDYLLTQQEEIKSLKARVAFLESKNNISENSVSAPSMNSSSNEIPFHGGEAEVSPADDSAEEPIDDPAEEERIYYSSRAIKEGDEAYFDPKNFKSTPFFYIIQAKGENATYRLNVEDEKYQRRYVTDFENIIAGTCKLEGAAKSGGRLCNVKEGKLRKEGEKWIIEELLVVKFD